MVLWEISQKKHRTKNSLTLSFSCWIDFLQSVFVLITSICFCIKVITSLSKSQGKCSPFLTEICALRVPLEISVRQLQLSYSPAPLHPPPHKHTHHSFTNPLPPPPHSIRVPLGLNYERLINCI